MSGSGVLLTGDSGTGKSELALQLVRRGHALVADDAPELSIESGRLIGRSSRALAGKLQLRGVGVVNLEALHGPDALQPRSTVDLIIQLSRRAEADARPLSGSQPGRTTLLGIPLPCWTVPVDRAPASPELIELAVALVTRNAGATRAWN